MIGLPRSTEFGKRVPKQSFYENMKITPELRQRFSDQIRAVYWRNKIAASTSNLAPGKTVTEIEVFEVRLTGPDLDEAVLRQMDRAIPYHTLFLLEYGGKLQARIGYKEPSGKDGNAFRVRRYYSTGWTEEGNLPLRLEGLNLDAAYENFVRQTAGDSLSKATPDEDLKASVERTEKIRDLTKRIESLQARMNSEKQLNRQMEINADIKRLKKELSGLGVTEQ